MRPDEVSRAFCGSVGRAGTQWVARRCTAERPLGEGGSFRVAGNGIQCGVLGEPMALEALKRAR